MRPLHTASGRSRDETSWFDDRIVAAACLFPLSENIALSKSTGTRHRAAIGVFEDNSAAKLLSADTRSELADLLVRGGRLDEADQLVNQAEQVELTAARQAQHRERHCEGRFHTPQCLQDTVPWRP